MEKIILSLREQLFFRPEFYFSEKIRNFPFDYVLIVGMGGSHLAGDLLSIFLPKEHFLIHSDYDLPSFDENFFKKTLIILSSFSGETEEVISALYHCQKKKRKYAIIAHDGFLLREAKKHKIPHVALPFASQPRFALGFSLVAFLKVLGQEKLLKNIYNWAENFRPEKFRKKGYLLSQKIKNKIPIIYASKRFFPLAYIWKINFNENTKIPAFCHFFPELNHNEMTGFDVREKTRSLSKNFHFIFLKAQQDDWRIKKRMSLLQGILKENQFNVEMMTVLEKNEFLEVFSFIALSLWTSFYLSQFYRIDPVDIPLVKRFKKLLENKK